MYINLVVLRMGAYESDVHHTIGIVDPHDQSVLVACNIENHSPIPKTLAALMGQAFFEDTGISEILLNIGGSACVQKV